jgi:beta-glucosidase
MRRILFPMLAFMTCFAGLMAWGDEETCAVCDRTILVTGQFQHGHDNAAVQSAAQFRTKDAYREEIYGSNFSLVVPHLPAGGYILLMGEAETDFTNAGQRIFDVTSGDETIVSNFDIFAATGSTGKAVLLKAEMDFPGDSVAGPLTVNFIGRTGAAKLNTFEIRDENNNSVISMQASDLVNPNDAGALKAPVVAGPTLWLDSSKPVDARVHDLVSRLSLAEKIQQMRNGAAAIPRLGIPAYNFWSECLHGIGRAGYATVFPQAIAMAATWDPSLIHDEADVIATEARAKFNEYTLEHNGDGARYHGLTFWTPNINIFRDPRWGRGQETYGEDPFLTAQFGVSFIRGLQGDDPYYIKAMACAKHFAVHSGPESERHTFDVYPSDRDFHETYLPQFEAAVREGHVGAVMGAYNSLFGTPACANSNLLTGLLRQQWGFQGHVVSDCGAVYDIYANHKFVSSPEEAAADAVKAGDDLCCGTDYNALLRAVRAGLISVPEIDTAVGRLFKARFQLGLFDPPEKVPYAQIPGFEYDTPAHAELALKVARESIVLLKNDGTLPLDRSKLKHVAVIGANAESVAVLVGNYNGEPSHPVTILDGIRRAVGANVEVDFEPGCPLATARGQTDAIDANMWTHAVDAAATADVVIYVGGISAELEGEQMDVDLDGFIGGDRTRIELPAQQARLLKALFDTGKPVIYVNCSGSAVAMPWAAENLPAIVQAWYPGEQGGRAVADVLFGAVNPAGRLPITFYRSTDDLPAFEDYSMSNRTYRYFSGTPQFAFGHGLSYTKFDYQAVKLDQPVYGASNTVTVSFTLKNSGARGGDEVAQVYFRHVNSAVPQPKLALCGFTRVHLEPGQATGLTVNIPAERLRYWDTTAEKYAVEPGDYELLIGAASDDIRLRVPLKIN